MVLSSGAVNALDAVAELRNYCGTGTTTSYAKVASNLCSPKCDGIYDWMIIEPVSHVCYLCALFVTQLN